MVSPPPPFFSDHNPTMSDQTEEKDIKTFDVNLGTGGYSIAIPAEATAKRDELIAGAKGITAIATPEEAETARLQMVSLASLRRMVENGRKLAKEPFLTKGKEVDDLAKNFIAGAEAEENRLKRLIGDHAAKLEKERQEALRKAEEERRRAEQEAARIAAEAKRLEEEEEAKKAKQVETGPSLDDFLNPGAAAEAEAEAEKKRAELARQQAAAQAAQDEANARSFAAVTAPVASGVSTELDYEVLDVMLLYKHHPELVEVKVKRADTLKRIRDYQKATGKAPTIPGLLVKEGIKVSTRG